MHVYLSTSRGELRHDVSPDVAIRQRGQIAPVALFGILIASAVLALMFDTSQKITSRSLVANAADAAAYSGAVWTARHLNFMAYTNRAMIANHAAVGHFISYVSWIRYVDDSIDYIDRVAQWIPYAGQYVDLVQQLVDEVRDVTEETAKAAVPAIDGWNATLRAAQVETKASLAAGHLQELMEQTARVHDPAIRINAVDDLRSLPAELRAALEAQLLEQRITIPNFVQRHAAGNDRNRSRELVRASLQANDDVRRWINGDRGWRDDLTLAQIRKRGSSTQTQGSSNADWNAADELLYRKRDLTGWGRWQRVGDRTSKASAREFASNYAGIPAYYNVPGEPGNKTLRIVALATLRSSGVAVANPGGMNSFDHPIAVAAFARVEFHRPATGGFAKLAGNSQEYANLFNPFWEAHLAPADFSRGMQ
ncbi:MAG: pilus assembly protein TadG-related protein [Steroidobacteraceae bacterium]